MRLVWPILIAAAAVCGILLSADHPGVTAQSTSQSTPRPAEPTAWLFLPHLSRQSSAAGPRPTPTFPPPLTPEPITGYVCARPPGPRICWQTADYTLARGPGAVCGPDMSTTYFLTSDTVNLELHTGQFVRLHGATESFPTCTPLFHVADLTVISTP